MGEDIQRKFSPPPLLKSWRRPWIRYSTSKISKSILTHYEESSKHIRKYNSNTVTDSKSQEKAEFSLSKQQNNATLYFNVLETSQFIIVILIQERKFTHINVITSIDTDFTMVSISGGSSRRDKITQHSYICTHSPNK